MLFEIHTAHVRGKGEFYGAQESGHHVSRLLILNQPYVYLSTDTDIIYNIPPNNKRVLLIIVQ